MDRKWIVQTEGKEHVVEVEYGALIRDEEDPGTFLQTDGKLVIDGNEIQTWEGGKLPKEISVDISKDSISSSFFYLGFGLGSFAVQFS